MRNQPSNENSKKIPEEMLLEPWDNPPSKEMNIVEYSAAALVGAIMAPLVEILKLPATYAYMVELEIKSIFNLLNRTAEKLIKASAEFVQDVKKTPLASLIFFIKYTVTVLFRLVCCAVGIVGGAIYYQTAPLFALALSPFYGFDYGRQAGIKETFKNAAKTLSNSYLFCKKEQKSQENQKTSSNPLLR